jgi:hypothetical protein
MEAGVPAAVALAAAGVSSRLLVRKQRARSRNSVAGRHEGLAKKAESVIYPDSPRLTGLNSHPINAGG